MIITSIRTPDRVLLFNRERMILATSFFLLLMWQIETCNCDLILNGKPDESYRRGGPEKAMSFENCKQEICSKDASRCQVIAFSEREFSCAEYFVRPSLIFLNPELMLKNKTIYKTKLKTANNIFRDFPKPKLLWLFDAAMKGKNIGTGGSKLDLDTSDIENWSYEGPSGTNMTFIYADQNSKYVKKVTPLIHNGVRLLSYKPAFTISFWVKTIKEKYMPLFSCTTTGIYCWISSNLESLNFFLEPHEKIMPKNKAENKLQWRHISISHCGYGLPTFYMNAQIWPISTTFSYKPVVEPTNILMRFGNSVYGFKGSMACFAIHEVELSPQQIRTMMKNCP